MHAAGFVYEIAELSELLLMFNSFYKARGKKETLQMRGGKKVVNEHRR